MIFRHYIIFSSLLFKIYLFSCKCFSGISIPYSFIIYRFDSCSRSMSCSPLRSCILPFSFKKGWSAFPSKAINSVLYELCISKSSSLFLTSTSLTYKSSFDSGNSLQNIYLTLSNALQSSLNIFDVYSLQALPFHRLRMSSFEAVFFMPN